MSSWFDFFAGQFEARKKRLETEERERWSGNLEGSLNCQLDIYHSAGLTGNGVAKDHMRCSKGTAGVENSLTPFPTKLQESKAPG
jgi:hypothetical protein